MKIAFVYDRVNKWGGAERVLLALHQIWPDAPLYTAVYDPARAGWADVFEVHPSFLHHIPFAKKFHELLAWITPLAFETFSFDQYDVVISVTSAEAKSIITKPGTIHICYCLTPTRYLWSGYKEYVKNPFLGPLLQLFAPTMRVWDKVCSSRPDYYIAISNRVKDRIEKYYHRHVDGVIYPPVDTTFFTTGTASDYFLVVSRLVGYKRIDIIIKAFNRLHYPLVIIGKGHEEYMLKRMAGKNIMFVSHHLTDSELVRYYQQCRAFVYAADEDFGISAVEAQACGKPVIAYTHSGLSETVIDGKTGILFEQQSVASLLHALARFEKNTFNPDIIRSLAEQFDQHVFKKKMQRFVEQLVQ